MIKLVWDTLSPPCCVCHDTDQPTTGVVLSNPDEVKYYCRFCLPEEYNELKIRARRRARR